MFNVLRKVRCEVCGVTSPDCLPQFERRNGKPVDVYAARVTDHLDYVRSIELRRRSRLSRKRVHVAGLLLETSIGNAQRH